MHSSYVLIFLIVPMMLLLASCGFKDIDKRFFVVSIGVDKAENSSKKYLVSLKLAIPETKNKPSGALIITEKADSMSEAVRILKTKADREIDFSHAKVIVLGEKVAKEKGNAGINYWFARRRDIQAIAWVAIGRPSALDILKVKPESEAHPSNVLFLALGKDGSETPYILSEQLFDFKKRLIERGLDPYLPIIEEYTKGKLEFNSVGLLDKSHLKLVLSPNETKNVNFFMNLESKSAIVAQRGKTKFVVNTEKVKTKYKIYTPKGKSPYIKVNVKISGTIEEATRRIANEKLSKFEKTVEKEVNQNMKAVLEKIQKAGVDPLGFGLRYRSRHFNKNDWEEWQRIYPTITFKVHSKVQIKDTGLIE